MFFLLLSNLFCLFLLQKTLQKVVCYKFFKAGSGSALKKAAGYGSALRRTAGFGLYFAFEEYGRYYTLHLRSTVGTNPTIQTVSQKRMIQTV